MCAKSSIIVLKMPMILDSNRGPQNAFFLLSTGTIIATNTVIATKCDPGFQSNKTGKLLSEINSGARYSKWSNNRNETQ